MSTQRISLLLLLCFSVFLSCNIKKNKSTTANQVVSTGSFDTVVVQPDEPLNIQEYTAAFTGNITQQFTVTPKQVSVLKGKQGLKLTVNPSVLEKEDGSPVDGKINVSMIELTNSEDLFKSNAATVSNGKLLVSGGSYFIGMECNGQPLRIKNGNSLRMEFPKLKDNEMELFYGNRDNRGNMNWVKADESLSFNTSQDYTPYNPPYSYFEKAYKSKYHLYDSLTSKVIFWNKIMTIREMVNILQKRGIDKDIDSVYVEPALWTDQYFGDYHRWRIEQWKKYRVISCKDQEAENDSIAKEKRTEDEHSEANRKYNEEWQRINDENSLTTQLQKYYSPSAVTKLGWINCDRFYNSPQNTEVQLELPITFNHPEIEYFIIYKSFNGLMNGKLGKDGIPKYIISNLPEGETATLIAFTKNNGQLFQCKEEFVIQKNKPVQLNFKNISAEEMTKMFGKNVRI